MAPAQGWHAQIGKCTKSFVLSTMVLCDLKPDEIWKVWHMRGVVGVHLVFCASWIHQAVVILAEGAIALSVTLSGDALFASWKLLQFPSSLTSRSFLQFLWGLRPNYCVIGCRWVQAVSSRVLWSNHGQPELHPKYRILSMWSFWRWLLLSLGCPVCSQAPPVPLSQRVFHAAPIFRLLLKVAVEHMHQCDFLNFWGV